MSEGKSDSAIMSEAREMAQKAFEQEVLGADIASAGAMDGQAANGPEPEQNALEAKEVNANEQTDVPAQSNEMAPPQESQPVEEAQPQDSSGNKEIRNLRKRAQEAERAMEQLRQEQQRQIDEYQRARWENEQLQNRLRQSEQDIDRYSQQINNYLTSIGQQSKVAERQKLLETMSEEERYLYELQENVKDMRSMYERDREEQQRKEAEYRTQNYIQGTTNQIVGNAKASLEAEGLDNDEYFIQKIYVPALSNELNALVKSGKMKLGDNIPPGLCEHIVRREKEQYMARIKTENDRREKANKAAQEKLEAMPPSIVSKGTAPTSQMVPAENLPPMDIKQTTKYLMDHLEKGTLDQALGLAMQPK